MSSKSPTVKQLAFLRTLAERTGRTFVTPKTSKEASVEIQKLKSMQPDSRLERRIERRDVADAIASGPLDGARVLPHEVSGWGSSATWSQRS